MIISPLSAYASAINVNLGTAGSFGVLAGSTVTNIGATVINGNVGVAPGAAITGFPPGIVVPPSTEYAADAVALGAKNDLTTGYNFAAGESCPGGDNLTGTDLGGLSLTPGVYCFSSQAQLTGILTLNDEGDPDSVFVFQIGDTLTTASGSSVAFINGSRGDVFWQVGSSATLGTGTAFEGNILAADSISLNTGATIACGSALAETGAVTMDTNQVSIGCGTTGIPGPVPSPEPSSAPLLLLIGGPGLLWLRKSRPARE
jgi:type VI secretion system secreted protein VgrG